MAMKFVLVVLALAYFERVVGHGMMLEPPNRASLWRFYPEALADYDDNGFFCGGVLV